MAFDGSVSTAPDGRVRPMARAISTIGVVGLVTGLLLAVGGWFAVSDFFRRIDATLLITSEAMHTVEATLDTADEALATLHSALAVAAEATDQASASTDTVAAAVDEAAGIIGGDLPESVEEIRTAMPGLIDAAAVIDRTLSGLAFFGVPYDPEVPLDEAFRNLDDELAPLPQSLRDNAETIAAVVPQADGFRRQALLLASQVERMSETVLDARSVIRQYRATTDRVDLVVADASNGLAGTELVARVLVLLGAATVSLAMAGLIMTGRALADLARAEVV
jgi:hypothetical protein